MSAEQESDSWFELEVLVDVEAVEPVSELFSRYAFQGIAVEEPFVQDFDGENLRVDPEKPFVVRAFMPANSFTPEAKQALEQGLWYIGRVRPVGSLSVTERQECDWEEAWKEHYVPVRVSSRFIVAPPWQAASPEKPDDLVIVLDPGMAFGTGTHPTSQLCLELFPDILKPADAVLDVGTGTGILAIAAALLGVGSIDAVDIESVAVRKATENVHNNALSDSIRIWQSDMTSPPEGAYDLVVANIVARVLAELSSSITSCVKPGGTLMLSGIIEDKESMVLDAYEALGFTLQRREVMGDWIAHLWTRTEFS